MAPTLTDGQLVLTRSLRPAHAVGRGDLVVLDSPVEPDQHVVKRVVGLPGEKVTFDAGRVSIDGRPLPEPYASPSVFSGEYDVPPRHFLVLGDNRDVSSDSRSWSRPYTPRAAIRGRLLLR
jgi:signal peptidase I